MASIYPRGARWWVKYRDPLTGKVERKSLGETVRTRAEALAVARALEIRSASDETLPEAVSLATALTRFLADKSPPLRAAWTHATYAKHASHFRRLLPCDLLLARLTSAHVKGYRDRRVSEGAAPQTVNKERTTLATLWRWAQLENDPPLVPRDRNPILSVKPLAVVHAEAEACSEAAYRAAVDELRHDAVDEGRRASDRYLCGLFADVLDLAWSTGLRAGEICALRPEDVRLEQHEISVHSTWNKGPAPSYPIPEEARPVLGRRLAHAIASKHAWVFGTSTGCNAYRSLYKFWSIWVRETPAREKRLRSVRVHALRHAYTTALDRAGVSEATLMKLTRHRTPRIRLRYTHRDLEDMRAAQRDLARARQARPGPPGEGLPPSGPAPSSA